MACFKESPLAPRAALDGTPGRLHLTTSIAGGGHAGTPCPGLESLNGLDLRAMIAKDVLPG
jgi:hypothetical protein